MKGQRHYLRGYVQRADGDEAGKPLTIIAATEGRKGDGLNLTMAGAELGRFESNPVVGYGHSYWGRDGLPIGRSDKTWIDDDKLRMSIAFDQEDDFARTVERKYRGGYMNAFSIGFDVWNIDDSGTPEGWELFEVSAVPLPMDPNAIVESGRSALDLARSLDVRSAPDEMVQAVLSRLAEVDAMRRPRGRGAVEEEQGPRLRRTRRAHRAPRRRRMGTDEDDDEERAAPLVDQARLLRLAGL